MRGFLILVLLLLPALCSGREQKDRSPGGIGALLTQVEQAESPEARREGLGAIRTALGARRHAPMPDGWPALYLRLKDSPDAAVRALALRLGTIFGDPDAFTAAHALLAGEAALVAERTAALEALVWAREPSLPADLQYLLRDRDLRAAAIRGLAEYDDPRTPRAILGVYQSLDVAARRDAINTLSQRAEYARALIEAVRAGTVPPRDVTAFVLRQVGLLNEPDIDRFLKDALGRSAEETPAQEIAHYKEMLPDDEAFHGANASRGRAIFARTCQQCHVIFDAGGTMGSDLTWLPRSDLDYLWKSIVDPHAQVAAGNELGIVRSKDGRLLTGLLRAEDRVHVTIQTESATITLPREEVESVRRIPGESVMPEHLLSRLRRDDLRDLITYIRSPEQVAEMVLSIFDASYGRSRGSPRIALAVVLLGAATGILLVILTSRNRA